MCRAGLYAAQRHRDLHHRGDISQSSAAFDEVGSLLHSSCSFTLLGLYLLKVKIRNTMLVPVARLAPKNGER